MLEINKDIKKEVQEITNYLLSYDNKDSLSWTKVYKETLKVLNLTNLDSNKLLSNTVKEISNRGYDIIPDPFKLERYR